MRIAPKTAGAFAVGAFLFLLIFGVAWPGPGAWLLVFGLLFIAVGAAAWWLDGSTVPVQGAVAVGGRGAAALSMGRPGGTPFRGAGRTGDSLLLQLGLPGLDARGQWMLPDRVHVAVPAGITGLLALLIFLGGALGGGSAATPNVPAVQSH